METSKSVFEYLKKEKGYFRQDIDYEAYLSRLSNKDKPEDEIFKEKVVLPVVGYNFPSAIIQNVIPVVKKTEKELTQDEKAEKNNKEYIENLEGQDKEDFHQIFN